MTLTELRYIVAVARAKHFGKAAEDCCVSQPTLSVGIRKLEDDLGVTIFERGRSEVRITPIGDVIITQAQHVLNETQVIRDIADADNDQLKKPIRIASTYTIGKYLFPHLVKQVYNYSPKLSLLLNQDYQDVLIQKLKKQDFDVLILSTDTNNRCYGADKDIRSLSVLKEDLYLLASRLNKYAEVNSIAINDIAIEDLSLLNKQHCLSKQILDLNPVWQHGSNKANETNFDTLESLYHVMKTNNGATIVPAMFSHEIANYDAHATKIIPFVDSKPSRELSLVWRKDAPRTQIVDILKQCLQKIDLAGLEIA